MWLTGLVAPWHVGSSQTRARTRVPCTSRQTLNHCATREVLGLFFNMSIWFRANLTPLQKKHLLENFICGSCIRRSFCSVWWDHKLSPARVNSGVFPGPPLCWFFPCSGSFFTHIHRAVLTWIELLVLNVLSSPRLGSATPQT